MATEDGIAEHPVILDLLRNPQRYTFYQAVSLLESFAEEQSSEAETVDVGYFGPVASEAVRFRPHASLGFPAADLKRITRDDSPQGSKFLMEVFWAMIH